MHYCVNRYGCPVHHHGRDDRRCSCRPYWVDEPGCRELLDGVESSKAWREDHDPVECAIHGGDCVGVASSIADHEATELCFWRGAVRDAKKYGWIGKDTPYWKSEWETENKYCRAVLEELVAR
jgi:hypothetical protein